MYLSRLQLDLRNRQVWRQVIRNPYTVHQLVMRGFADGVKREKAQVLHRLEVGDEAAVLLVQSDVEPDWSTVEPDYLAVAGAYDFLPNPAIKPLKLPLQRDQVLSFRLQANPTKKMRRLENDPRKHSNRVPLVHEEQQIEWLKKRGETAGFRVRQVTISRPQQQKIWKQKGEKPITLYSVRFEGHLQVTDPEALREAIQKGIGPSKAFGCGLLSLARA